VKRSAPAVVFIVRPVTARVRIIWFPVVSRCRFSGFYLAPQLAIIRQRSILGKPDAVFRLVGGVVFRQMEPA
jgi:hypothetical protein